MRLAVAQLDTSGQVPGDAARRLLEAAALADRGGAQLVICPYATLSHPVSPDLSDQIDYALELTDAVTLITKEASCPMLLCGGIDMNGYSGNIAIFVHDGVAEPVSVGMRQKNPMGAVSIFSVDGVRFAVACTYDDLDDMAEDDIDADVVVFASAYGFVPSDALSAMGAGYSEGHISDLARDLDTWLVGAGSLGGYGEDIFCGASYVCAPWGELAASAPAFEEHLLMCDFEPDAEGPLSSPAEPAYFDRALMMWLGLSLGLSDLLRARGAEDVALALDGGLASSLCCVLASDALGPTHVHAIMPATLDEQAAAHAASIAETLGVIRHASDAKLLRLAKDESTVKSFVQLDLARLAKALGAVPLAAVDKTGLALEADALPACAGWLAPLGDVYRLDLVELARLRNTISPVIPREILRECVVPPVEGIEDVASSVRGRLEFADMVLMSRVEGGRTSSELAHTFGHAPVIDTLIGRLCDLAPMRRGFAVLRASSRPLGDTVQPMGLVWRSVAHDQPVAERIDAIMSRVTVGEISPGDEVQVRDMIATLNDLTGSMSAPAPRQNPLGWGIPFSEN